MKRGSVRLYHTGEGEFKDVAPQDRKKNPASLCTLQVCRVEEKMWFH